MSCLLLRRFDETQHTNRFHLIELGLHVDIRVQHRRVLDFSRVIHLVHAHHVADLGKGSAIASTDHDVRLFGCFWILELLDIGFHLTGEAVGEVKDGTAPELALLEGAHIVLSDDAKIVSATAERDEEIFVLVRVGIDDFSRS